MPEPRPVPPASTFVVRLWREWSATGPRWRGWWVEHVQSGEDTAFLNLGEMLRFIRRFGAMAGDEAGFREPPVAPFAQ